MFYFTLIDVIDALLVCLECRFEFGDCWPLDSDRMSIIMGNYLELRELLDTDDDLIEAMFSKSCFTQQQLTSILSVSDLHDRNKKLLDILTRSSRENFNRFVDCLFTTQPHIATLLSGDEGTHLMLAIN